MIALRSSAKLNLTLEILGRRPDGYHELRSVVQTISLWDEIVLRSAEAPARVSCNWPELETPDNLCLRAANLLAVEAGVGDGVHVELTKRIPLGAGLGGGSGNAAAVLIGLDELWELTLPVGTLRTLAVKLGADVPFFLTGGGAMLEGIGERIAPVDIAAGWVFVVAQGGRPVSTAAAYAAYDRRPTPSRTDHERFLRCLRDSDIDNAARMFDNVLEPAAVAVCPEIAELKNALLRQGALGAAMTGSGSAVFGAFPSEEQAVRACAALRALAPLVQVAHPTPRGVERTS
ncbi:MAG: 4-(cytidine 5'-diphospho)-2-C-methyl-D-erythritol kinase [Armatimonadetes bacterium CG_4_9_14_3_um_filter_66_14]|nr:4-(cytidine 5'-diphospho)-2-C-methyl-D-erythritol kinase [Armatimonadota bacterium]PJB71141.1 MAG: 4-(cytidine 5'-diphospho)-2-C-methyl-D-erythritol kinase [Armatimonadetes bacterium CG_4_9_14_3_um_filter_66_14]